MQDENRVVNVTVLSGAALSEAIDFRGMDRMVIHMPAAWTAASIAFAVSSDADGTFIPLNDDADALIEIDTPVADTAYLSLPMKGVRFVKLWSETAGVSVNQGADRALIVNML